ncbi:hypothetical protein KVF89_10830 [Nocardioides carbamazepini]|uniref:hypothetical protein n=1 Tax=Nocardioides carbamazepini TaxID=2854259 RepID=UPI00214A8AEC|nr:hypothetical protein [Nocardioides carbamazepini]MCR1783030.1 hypothetical protein [Nocardioides carbamazepini]
MTDHDSLDTLVGPALRERLNDERPDLEHLAATSLSAGLRLRRRRLAVSGAAAGVAAVAAVSVGAGLLSGGGTAARDDSGAQRPTATATVTAPGAATTAPAAEGDPAFPVVVDVPGWTCEYFAIDEKAWCTRGELGVSVVARPRSEYEAWKGNPDKEGSALWMSAPHGNYFATLQGGEGGLSPADLDAFVDGLVFAPRWDRPAR